MSQLKSYQEAQKIQAETLKLQAEIQSMQTQNLRNLQAINMNKSQSK